ncbi:hypothetical protein XFF6991_420018 [Xanthomonas phaseoli pv. phaseoli]|uniref:Uncharacterized protein n=1 Tax=Xanthomonas campestris pv. phaseoli TaxID=317013 RepID=A0A7Z7J037_XANCH|nr:hypothetical protein XFF6991_420018 [Xanthomonas phaseoli pv. phaseoli]
MQGDIVSHHYFDPILLSKFASSRS